MWVPSENGKVSLAWQIKILPHDSNAYWLVRVDAHDQSLLGKDNLTLSDNWNDPAKATAMKPGLRRILLIK